MIEKLSDALSEVLARLDERTEGEFLERLANGHAIALQCMEFVREHGPAIAAALRAVEGAAEGTFEEVTSGVSYIKWWDRDAPDLDGQSVLVVPLDAAGSAEGVE